MVLPEYDFGSRNSCHGDQGALMGSCLWNSLVLHDPEIQGEKGLDRPTEQLTEVSVMMPAEKQYPERIGNTL